MRASDPRLKARRVCSSTMRLLLRYHSLLSNTLATFPRISDGCGHFLLTQHYHAHLTGPLLSALPTNSMAVYSVVMTV